LRCIGNFFKVICVCKLNNRIMKQLLFGICMFFGLQAVAQSTDNQVTLFAQCMIAIDSQDEMKSLELLMRENVHAKIVRLDHPTQRAFILTKGIDQLNEQEFKSWFGEYSDKVWCVQIGRHGVDEVKPYPFQGCGPKP
jgi:hypothetical protein